MEGKIDLVRRMSEYYWWVNVDRREYLWPGDFDSSAKWMGVAQKNSRVTGAMRALLSMEWGNDHIVYLGDETLVSPDSNNATLRILYKHTEEYNCPGDAPDAVFDTYRNVSGLFVEAEKGVREEIAGYLANVESDFECINTYGIHIQKPFAGLFQRHARTFRYTLNHSRKEAYSFQETAIRYQDGTRSAWADPLPGLLCYGTKGTGAWLGDVIGVSNRLPEGYSLLKEIYLNW